VLLIVVEGRVSNFSYFLYLLCPNIHLTFRKDQLTLLILSSGDVLVGLPGLAG
jgi:hypothetical protein